MASSSAVAAASGDGGTAGDVATCPAAEGGTLRANREVDLQAVANLAADSRRLMERRWAALMGWSRIVTIVALRFFRIHLARFSAKWIQEIRLELDLGSSESSDPRDEDYFVDLEGAA